MSQPLLSIQNLRVEFANRAGAVPVIDDLSLTLEPRSRVSIVGESGCGKSVTALAIMGLLPKPIAKVVGGRILFDGEDLVTASEQRLQEIRGHQISMIFQEPMTSLNPVYTIGDQIAEVMRRHLSLTSKQARKRAVELLEAVQIPEPGKRQDAYPHELSGGQRQRVMIAIALACEPKILIADEPTTALDVTVQAGIFDLLMDLHRDISTAIVLITHDMGAVCRMSEEMIVMYAGRKVETGRVEDVIAHPSHPYTRGLIDCVPHVRGGMKATEKRLAEIPGIVPPISEFGKDACMFAPRCHYSEIVCEAHRPNAVKLGRGHDSFCHFADKFSKSSKL